MAARPLVESMEQLLHPVSSGEEEKEGRASWGAVVCSRARGRGWDDASGRPVEPGRGEREREGE